MLARVIVSSFALIQDGRESSSEASWQPCRFLGLCPSEYVD